LLYANCVFAKTKSVGNSSFCGVAYLHIKDVAKGKSVSLSLSEFEKLVEMRNTLNNICDESLAVSFILYTFFYHFAATEPNWENIHLDKVIETVKKVFCFL